jgi:hypothetical protein
VVLGPCFRRDDKRDTPPHSRGVKTPELCQQPPSREGAGNAGCALHPQSRVQKVKSTRGSHHEFTGTTRHSPRNGFNGFLRDLPGDRALLSPSFVEYGWSAPGRADFASAKLDASIEASGPHDFAVRSTVVRLHACASLTGWTPPCDDDCAPTLPRPPHPVPTSVTIAKRPSVWDGMAGVLELIWAFREAVYFSGKDWTTQITLIPHENFALTRIGPHSARPGARRWARANTCRRRHSGAR